MDFSFNGNTSENTVVLFIEISYSYSLIKSRMYDNVSI